MTRLHVVLCGAVACLACAVAQAAPNVLLNPGFETDAVLDQEPFPGATEWTFQGNGVANTTSSPLDPVRTGIGSLQFVANGGFGVPLMRQEFPASPGQRWDLQGYMLTKDALPTGPTLATLKIVFVDAFGGSGNDLQLGANAVIAGQADDVAFPGILALPQLNNTSAVNTWQFSHASGIAPPGTAAVRFFALVVDENPATAYFDDVQAFLAGDFDADLDVDGLDLPFWKDAYAKNSGGDADGDGDSDGNDFLIWQRQLAPPPPVGVAAPEPSSMLLIASGLALMGRRRRQRRAN